MPESKTVQAKGQFMNNDRISQRMTHVGLIVTKLDAEYKFYTDILGFTETWRGSSSGKVLSWINLKVPDGDDYIEFMLAAQAPDPTHRGGGSSYVSAGSGRCFERRDSRSKALFPRVSWPN